MRLRVRYILRAGLHIYFRLYGRCARQYIPGLMLGYVGGFWWCVAWAEYLYQMMSLVEEIFEAILRALLWYGMVRFIYCVLLVLPFSY